MYCCENCFKDRFLINKIRNNNIIDSCDYCYEDGVKVIKVDDLADVFAIFIPYYEKLEHGEHFIHEVHDPVDIGEFLYDLIQHEWMIFSAGIEGQTAKSLLTDIMLSLNSEYSEADLYVKAAEAVYFESTLEVWDNFSEELKHGNRFFPSKGYIAENIVNILKENNHIIPQSAIFYRGRIGKHIIDNMGAPPNEIASPGRANPRGISYLYASPQRKTCVAELRPYKSAVITLVEMTAKRQLKFVSLNTGRALISPFQFNGNLLEATETLSLYQKLVFELSKPVSPDNSEIDYLPTQYLSELIKNEGFDGFMFKSSLGPGDNYVIFNEKNVDLNSVEFCKIDEIQYTVHQSF
ncbi:RES domain-containing protein [Bacillus cihuensis]|uniref:RES domain-containing protein n=1 Tax=Bacillus cihuensis TaxID=1208599 RepID=UPI00040723F5|nr:RES domain-containing protein [Bacillus cihuensis]